MKQRIIGKGLAVAVIILFLGLGIQPSVAVQPAIATVESKIDTIDAEPKDFLFQTIIDIANNPEVKELLEQYDNDLFKVDIDRSVYRKIFLRNPRLMFNMLFTKPSISVEYLNKCYNSGIEITNILGEDKVFEIADSIKVNNPQLYDKISNIIKNDEVLINKVETPPEPNLMLCIISIMISVVFYLILGFPIVILTYFWYCGLYFFYIAGEAMIYFLAVLLYFNITLCGVDPPWEW